MKRFIRYLYEYEQGKRKRNVGFVKVEQDEEECTIHIHGKGLRLESGSNFQVYLFYAEGSSCIGVCQGEIGYMGPALNYRLRYTKEDVGVPQNYDKVSGVLLNGAGRSRFAALWDDIDIDIEHMQIWQEDAGESAQAEGTAPNSQDSHEGADLFQEAAENAAGAGEMQEDMETLRGGESTGMQEGLGVQEDIESLRCGEGAGMQEDIESLRCGGEAGMWEGSEVQEDIESLRCGRETEIQEDIEMPGSGEEAAEAVGDENDGDDIGTPVWKVTKIQRKDLTMLPRCEWRLANNNFLLHGYYNYRHLVLLDSGTILKLGVPGIYHEKEARAAEGFGFPEFINADETKLSLKPEECNKEELFGYWCRQVRRRSM